ncbi:MAG: metalloregulator ArsR/SmtB family transcription factor [Alphaproteobacteria bacterium]|nr:metalloregulator ArsR/SmtB family transcription factor [Alphaproteobacteria bacterium]
MSIENPKRRLFELFATVAKALGHGHRLELLEHLAQGERGVDGLAELSGLTIANASQHLQHLRRAGLVASRRKGKHVLYQLADDGVIDLLGSLRGIAERNLAEVDRVVDRYFRNRDSFEPVSRADLIDRSHQGLVTVLDVRPEEEFLLGHVPGAVNIPLGDLERRLAELDPKQEIVAYCRGPWCVLSFEAVAALRQRGFAARRLEDGLPEWQAAGLPVERTSATGDA